MEELSEVNPKKVQCALNSRLGSAIRHWLDGRVKAHIFICYLSYLLMKTLEHMLKKVDWGNVSTSKLSIPSRIQRQIINYGCAGDRVYKV